MKVRVQVLGPPPDLGCCQTSSVASRRLQSVVLEDWPWGKSQKPRSHRAVAVNGEFLEVGVSMVEEI